MCRHTGKVALLDLGTFGHTWCNFHKHVGLTKIKSINEHIDNDVDIPLLSICQVTVFVAVL